VRRTASDSFSHARSCGCVRVLLQKLHNEGANFNMPALPPRIGSFRRTLDWRYAGESCVTLPNTERKSDALTMCSALSAAAPQIQQVDAMQFNVM
jgi:hypothetical protein